MPNSKDIFTLEELMKSWKKVKTKSGSNLNDSINGLEDEVSVKEYLQEILDELVEGKYVPDPVRQYIRVRSDSGKEQKISILTFRDKIVQQTLVNYLQPLFEPQFLDCSYAYRQGRSALLAADQIQTLIHGGNTWVLETDIASFFDTMNHEILIDRLKEKVDDLHVINLINAYLKSPHFCEMSFYSAEEGVSIGGIISPLLSNIYLHELDQDMIKGGYTYIRYSDDLIVLGTLKEEMRQALFLITTVLKKLNLNINKSKTAIRHVSEGFVFLGFRFDDKGRGPAVKAIEALKQNIDIVNKRNLLATERLTELETVLQGWSNYYGSITWLAPADFSTLVALISRAAADNNQEWAHKLLEQKDLLVDGTPELHLLLARKLVNLGLIDEALTEYGYALADETLQKEAKIEIAALLPVGSDTLEQICEQLVLLSAEPRCAATYHVLSELYLAAGLYSQAQSAHSRAAELESREAKTAEDALIQGQGAPKLRADTEKDAGKEHGKCRGGEQGRGEHGVVEPGRSGPEILIGEAVEPPLKEHVGSDAQHVAEICRVLQGEKEEKVVEKHHQEHAVVNTEQEQGVLVLASELLALPDGQAQQHGGLGLDAEIAGRVTALYRGEFKNEIAVWYLAGVK